jgi:hypothetical protein
VGGCISDRINAIAGALSVGGGGVPTVAGCCVMLRAVLTWSACPPELCWTPICSGPCCGVRILSIASVLPAAAAALLYGWGAWGYSVVLCVGFVV